MVARTLCSSAPLKPVTGGTKIISYQKGATGSGALFSVLPKYCHKKALLFEKESVYIKKWDRYYFSFPGVLPLELDSSLEGSPASGSASACPPSASSAAVGSVAAFSPQPTLRKAAMATVIEIVIIVFFMIG